MPAGFITTNFASPFNAENRTLTINNFNTGIVVRNVSITPNDSYIIQPTGFGTIKTVWSHLSLSGNVTLSLTNLEEFEANAIDELCQSQDSEMYVSFFGYLYRTESIDVTIKPQKKSTRLDMTLTFYGTLPYATPIFRPNFSTLYSTDLAEMPDSDYNEFSLMPLPGNTLKNREDTFLLIGRNTETNDCRATVTSTVMDYTDSSFTYEDTISSNYSTPSQHIFTHLSLSDGEDVFAYINIEAGNIKIRYHKVVDNTLILDARPSVIIPEAGVTRIICDGQLLYAHVISSHYKSIRYDLNAKNVAASRKVVLDSSNFSTLDENGNPIPEAPYTGTPSNVFILNNKYAALFLNVGQTINKAYNSYRIPATFLTQIPGFSGSYTVVDVKKVEEHKLLVFLANAQVNGNYVHYVVLNFKDYDEDLQSYYTPVITRYVITSTNINAPKQIDSYIGVSQNNTVVVNNGHLYMSTEGYSDFYKEENVMAYTISTMQHKVFAMKDSVPGPYGPINKIKLKMITK